MERAMCPQCGGPCVEIRGKLVCQRCGRIVEGCCEGGPPLDEARTPAICGSERGPE
ncbi:MAG: hypothetical protein ACR2N6_07285 [Miltoncostaeaceae bacterium]